MDFPCYPLNESLERSQNRSRFTSEVTKHSYEVRSKSSQTVATATFYFNPSDFNEGPFGEVLRATGNPPSAFGFSTKYRDSETGDVNYGLRILRPPLGRWLSRDPAEERGGLNLFGFVANNGVNNVDLFGLTITPQQADGTDIKMTFKNYKKYQRSYLYTPTGESASEGDAILIAKLSDGTTEELKITLRRPKYLTRRITGNDTSRLPWLLNITTITQAVWRVTDQLDKPLGGVTIDESFENENRHLMAGGFFDFRIYHENSVTDSNGETGDTYKHSFFLSSGYISFNQILTVDDWSATTGTNLDGSGGFSGTLRHIFK